MMNSRIGKKALKKICVEEHFGTGEYVDLLYSIYQKTYPVPEVIEEEKYLLQETPFLPIIKTEPYFAGVMEKVCDLDKGRLEDMDKFGIETQIISHMSPGVQYFDRDTATRLARGINDKLAVATKKHPKKFSGLATIPNQVPIAAADELERAVKDLGFRGVVINSHTKGKYLDDKKY